MTYLIAMAMLLQNAIADERTQERIDLARVECGVDQRLQHQLDIKQTALDDARQRNYDRIAEIAVLN